ncbi:hypothetical protein O3M35_000210 [Rhynocoris fuscipes]|uniref:Vitellogenin n=1 Tax=Rhynocoris fuscipes TaxID=488301 RepID=A0AAW1DNM2_9HEMI
MKFSLAICIITFYFHQTISEKTTLFPLEKELTYGWNIEVSSGTVIPTVLNVTWRLESLVTVQQSENDTIFKIKLKESMGNLSDVAALELPFRATFDYGSFVDITASKQDEKWSINMKRALLSLIQLKIQRIEDELSFIDQEDGIYGNCIVEYGVIAENGIKKVHKIIDHDSCKTMPIEQSANCAINLCPNSNYQKIISSNSEREYIIDSDGEIYLKNVSAIGRLLIQPHQATAEAHYSKIIQSFDFISISDVKERIEVDADNQTLDTTYEVIMLDPTYGKQPSNRTVVVNEIYYLLEELSDSLSTWEVGVKGLDNQTSFYIVDLMWWLDVDDWEKLYSTITLGTSYKQETIQHLFWDLVPQVGSQSAALFIKQLVTAGRIKGFLASRLLINFPFYLKEMSEDLLTQYEELLRLETLSKEVKHSAVLSFAHLIHKICKTSCKTDTLDRYAKLYLDKFTESKKFEDQMLYLQGLSNIELGQVLDFLTSVIKDKSTSNKHIRFLAVWATLHTVHINPDKVYEVYWPIFSNKSESLELRVAAFTLLIMSKPTQSRFFSLYWHMLSEKSEQLYNFYYTTIQSLARTNYPCYLALGRTAARLARFVPAKSRQWATGNYLLDYEDPDRGYGGFIQTLLFASERTGLPNVFMFMIEQHSLGHTRFYALYLKVEGLAASLHEALNKISLKENKSEKFSQVLNLLMDLKVPVKNPENLHLEIILKIDGRTIIAHYMNQTSFSHWTEVVKKLSSLYFEFSMNYQSLNFPMIITTSRPSDIGTPALIQFRSASLISTRGSISQENEGKARNAEIDLRYSWNGVTSLKMYNPLDNLWYGTDRCRNLHIRLPFTTHLIVHAAKPILKITAVRHPGFVTGSRLGLVWHASTRIASRKPILKSYPNISDEWTMDSEDLGARLGASVFDCSHPDTLPDTLHLLKRAFLANHKNYNLVPGGVVLLGLLSLYDQLQFQPQGSSCGVMLYFTPLLTQVEPEMYLDRTQYKLSMNRKDGLLWEIKAGSKRLPDGNEEFTFKLYRAPSVSVTVAHIWRVIQLEGAFIVPSRMAGVFHSPAALTGYAFVSWGDAAPSQADKAGMLDLKIIPGHNDTGDLYCSQYTPRCLQAASDLAARQTATLQYANLPIWLKTAAHALFPEHIQTEGTHTQVTFAYPVALLPWNTKGLCAISRTEILTLDNATISNSLSPCFSLAVADCSKESQFSVQIKEQNTSLVTRIRSSNDFVDLIPNANNELLIYINNDKLENVNQGYQRTENDKTQLSVRVRSGITEIELGSEVVLQHYNTTVVILVPAEFRGYTCGMCADFNGDTLNEPSKAYTKCDEPS